MQEKGLDCSTPACRRQQGNRQRGCSCGGCCGILWQERCSGGCGSSCSGRHALSLVHAPVRARVASLMALLCMLLHVQCVHALTGSAFVMSGRRQLQHRGRGSGSSLINGSLRHRRRSRCPAMVLSMTSTCHACCTCPRADHAA